MALGDIKLINNKEYIDLTPKMIKNAEPSPYKVEATSENLLSAYKAFDDDPKTYYRSMIGFKSGSIQMYFGKEVVCNCYTLTAGNVDWNMKDWEFQGSNDGGVWDTLHTVNDMTSWDNAEKVHIFEFENEKAYSYYRINCSGKNGGNSIFIGEWKFYERRKTTMTFHKVLEKNVPQKVTSGNDEIYFTNEGNIYISRKDGTLMKINGAGSIGGAGGSLNKLKLNVLTDGQTEFETRILPVTSIDKMNFYLVVNSNIYIDEINATLNSNGEVLITFDNSNFDLEINDVVYLLYTDESKNSSGGGVGDIIINELSNPLTTNPLEYGYFNIGKVSNITLQSKIPLTKEGGNLDCDGEWVTVSPNTMYEVYLNMYSDNALTSFTSNIVSDVGEIVTRELAITSSKILDNYSRVHSVKSIFTTGNSTSKMKISVNTIFENTSMLGGGELIIQEVRNNPIAQYGGFETEILFDGDASGIGEYILTDTIKNYDFLYVTGVAMNDINTFEYYETLNILEVNDVTYTKSPLRYSLVFPNNVGKATIYDSPRIGYSFSSEKVLYYGFVSLGGSSFSSLKIKKVIGIKGQIPSLLVGGEF